MSSNASLPNAKVVPAQLAFLAIYNPAFGDTDENAYDQILYYFEKDSSEDKQKRTTTKNDRDTRSPTPGSRDPQREGAGRRSGNHSDVDEEEEQVRKMKNERLRQVGLARGMVEFANNFSHGVPVDSVETEKSRIVLQELESGWWVLASVDLTRLPVAATRSAVNSSQDKNASASVGGSAAAVEYSAREVSPPQLLRQQLLQANSMFLLHHAPTLNTLYNRLGREVFSHILAKFWDRFVWQWDVLLHGNPAVDIYNCLKLAGGGELGVGVGEEEWGSGEREVLEGFLSRTEGLVDLVVGRYGDGPVEANNGHANNKSKDSIIQEQEPWLGNEGDPQASDGIIFSGTGVVSRRSLATVSQWMEAIFKYGDGAYGVGDNPSSRPRHRRRRRKVAESANGDATRSRLKQQEEILPRIKSPLGRAPDLRRKAMENNAAPPGIPAPLVGAVERSLENATSKAKSREASKSPREEKTQSETMKQGETDDQSSLFGTDKMMKYLSLGYGSSWTLNPKGFGGKNDTLDDEDGTRSTSSTPKETGQDSAQGIPPAPLEELDPTPEVSDEEDEPFVQRLEQSIGKFLIGLSGDLENAEFEPDADDDADTSATTPKPQRIFMRTLTLQLARPRIQIHRGSLSAASRHSAQSLKSMIDDAGGAENARNLTSAGKTSASASVDGAAWNVTHEKLQVAVYVHQPFVFVFLFDLHTPNLTIPSFYRGIHHLLGPLQKPLLRSTDPERVRERIAGLLGGNQGNTTSKGKESTDEGTKAAPSQQTIYDLIYDPTKLTVRTSLPNIPIPGSLAAEGLSSNPSASTMASGSWYTLGIPIGSSNSATPSPGSLTGRGRLVKSDWTRIEALNVHTQILNSWAATRGSAKGEIERTVKTGRGWWVLWMQVMGLVTGDRLGEGEGEGRARELKKEAFLVRKAPVSDVSTGGSSGRWLLRDQRKQGSSGGDGGAASTTSTRGVVEGVGVDARKWIDGLLHLSQ